MSLEHCRIIEEAIVTVLNDTKIQLPHLGHLQLRSIKSFTASVSSSNLVGSGLVTHTSRSSSDPSSKDSSSKELSVDECAAAAAAIRTPPHLVRVAVRPEVPGKFQSLSLGANLLFSLSVSALHLDDMILASVQNCGCHCQATTKATNTLAPTSFFQRQSSKFSTIIGTL